MFTGIVTHTSKITAAKKRVGSITVRFERPWGAEIAEGDSVNINGICSTVRSVAARQFEVEYMPETVAQTTAGEWKKGRTVNVELSLRASDRLSGHIVQGHVDFTARVLARRDEGDWHVLRIALPPGYKNHVVQKGSVAVDGVSLTISGKGSTWFEVSLIKYTRSRTNLGSIKKGDTVNVETDIVWKYIIQRSAKHATRGK